MKRCGTLDEIAAMACFIVSRETSFTTGFNLRPQRRPRRLLIFPPVAPPMLIAHVGTALLTRPCVASIEAALKP